MDALLQAIKNKEIASIIKDYQKCIEKDIIKDFNVFTITSDLYYRENYHSDILKAFLEYKDSRTGKYPLLESFINMLNVSRKEIQTKDYLCPEIVREHHHMDILIRDENSKHCIIIENKINNAPDMKRQLPRYYDRADGDRLLIDAIVYLAKYPNTLPDKIGWKDGDTENISKVFVSLPVYDGEKEVSLLNWIDNSIDKVNDIDVLSVLRQYKCLLSQIVNDMKGLEMLKKINEELQTSSDDNMNIENIIALRDTLNQLPNAMAKALQDKLVQAFPEYKGKIGQWEPNSCVVRLSGEKRIYVYCELDAQAAYKVYAADFSKPNNNPSWILRGDLEDYAPRLISNEGNKGVGFKFGYYESAEVIELITQMLEIYNSNKS